MTATPPSLDAVPDELRTQRAAWDERPLVRALYTGWYERMIEALSGVEGPTVELGAGIGTFKEIRPATLATDVVRTPWADEVVDAQALPYGDDSLANLVMTDVFHHLPRPFAFLAEAERVLAPGGRTIMVEPFCSAVSTPLYKRFHHELTDLGVDPFSESPQSGEDPFDSNQALPTVIFWHELDRYLARHPRLPVVRRERLAWLLYPLSGGFTGRQRVPYSAAAPLGALENALAPIFTRFAAFRCLICLEKRG